MSKSLAPMDHQLRPLAKTASIDTTSRDRDFWNPVHPGSARADYTRSEQHRFHAQRRASFTQTTV
jgi:hypothetical protein